MLYVQFAEHQCIATSLFEIMSLVFGHIQSFDTVTQVHYVFCQEVVANYVDSFETYANFKEVV